MPYLFIKIGVEELTPGFVAWSRVALAALVLLPIAIKTGALRGLPLRWLVAFAAVEIAVPFPLIGFGEQRISSSLAAILIAALPLVVSFLALRFDHAERPTPVRLAGMLVGLAGVVALVGIDIGGRGAGLLGGRLPPLLPPHRRGRTEPGDRDHLRQPDRGSRPRRGRARRERDRGSRRRPAADPRRLVARHRRPPATRPGRDRHPRPGPA